MYISYQWLQEYLSLPDSADELAKKMSLTGIEIEGVHTIGAGLKKIVVGETLEVIDHPDSDHLHICQVSVGEHAENGVLQIVCGAPNVAKGQKVIVALVGARIKDNIKIKKGKIRGQESQGMLCSLEELGFPTQVIPKDYADGIFILPPDAPIGADIIEYMHLDDAVLELSITPNRADALSVYGTAYEVGAIYHQTPQIPVQPLQVDTKDHVDHYVKVGVANSTDCPAYYMTVIKDVNIAPSPLWLQMRLMSIGVRPVNNVVDVTNYMLMLYGQPLHAFDYASLMSKDVLVRRAKSDEMLVSLDGSLRELTSTDLIITANDKPVALAGIMGGLETEITEQTTTVALEAAVFNPKCVRATSKRLNLRSEASARFEKGLNLALVQHVIEQASSMIAELANGQVVSGIQSVNTLEVKPIQVRVTLAKINHVLGTCLSDNDLQHIFERLGFETVYESGVYSVSIPPRRWDIHIEADIIEEVARIYGYDNLPATLPTTPSISGGLSPMRQFIRLTNRLLETSGYMQTISYSLTSTQKAGLLAMRDNLGVSLALPMSEERSVLRRSLLTGLLDIAMYNVARSTTNLALYETGRVFYATKDNQQPLEEEHIALLLTGNRQEKSWYGKSEKVDFYDIKGTLDAYFTAIGLQEKISYQASQKDNMHPGRTADILLDQVIIGYVGQIHPNLAKQYDLGETFVAELEALPLLQAKREPLIQQTVPKYPSMSRDIALLVDESINHQDIMAILKQTGGKYLNSIHLFDHYMGEGIEPGKKSLAYRLSFLNVEATLVEEEVNTAMANIVEALTSQLHVSVR